MGQVVGHIMKGRRRTTGNAVDADALRASPRPLAGAGRGAITLGPSGAPRRPFRGHIADTDGTGCRKPSKDGIVAGFWWPRPDSNRHSGFPSRFNVFRLRTPPAKAASVLT